MPEGHPAAAPRGAEYSCANAACLVLSLLLLCCQLWSYATMLVFSNRPGTGEAADSNPKLPSPSPREAGGIMRVHSPLQLSGLEELKVHLCLFIAKKSKVSGKHVQARAELAAGYPAVWLPPEAASTAQQQHLLPG